MGSTFDKWFQQYCRKQGTSFHLSYLNPPSSFLGFTNSKLSSLYIDFELFSTFGVRTSKKQKFNDSWVMKLLAKIKFLGHGDDEAKNNSRNSHWNEIYLSIVTKHDKWLSSISFWFFWSFGCNIQSNTPQKRCHVFAKIFPQSLLAKPIFNAWFPKVKSFYFIFINYLIFSVEKALEQVQVPLLMNHRINL